MSIHSLVSQFNAFSGAHSDPAPNKPEIVITPETLQQSGVTAMPSGLVTFDEEVVPTGVYDDET